jgi:apyrase
MAARAAVLKEVAAPLPHPCVTGSVSYGYAGATLAADGPTEGAAAPACAAAAAAALRIDATCAPAPPAQCGFAGAWGGGGGDGASAFYVSSYFWDRAAQAGAIPAGASAAPLTPHAFAAAADAACAAAPDTLQSILKDAPAAGSEDASLFCLDLSYCHALLTQGFGLADAAPLTLVKQVEYKGRLIEAAWPLGAAINALGAAPQPDGAAGGARR